MSKLYSLLLDLEKIEDPVRLRWERDMQQELELKEWDETHRHVKSISVNIAIRENIYKLRYRRYLTPKSLHRMFSTVEPKCWRCNEEEGNLIHIWGACAKIQT